MNCKRYTLLGVIGMLVLLSCKHRVEGIPDPTNGSAGGATGGSMGGGTPCDPTKIYFQQQVLPILVSNCALSGCHDAPSHRDGVILTSYADVMRTADVRPGNPGASELYEVLVDDDPDDRMPLAPRNPLSLQQIQIIRQWIQQGAMNLACDNMCDANSFTYNDAIKVLVANKCQGCHSGAAPQGSIDLSTYNGLKAKVNDGRLWGAINHQVGFSPMPKNGAKLSECEIQQVKKWIDAGAPNN
jgi:hypothetical protein